VVDFAFSLPVDYKISGGIKKNSERCFADVLPAEILTRPKHGFEVPLLGWMQTGSKA